MSNITKSNNNRLIPGSNAMDALSKLKSRQPGGNVQKRIEGVATQIVETASQNLAMEKATRVEVIFILDISLSMAGTERDVCNGFNRFVNSQSKYTTAITTYLFYEKLRKVHDKVLASSNPQLHYTVDSGTSCYDALVKVLRSDCATATCKKMVVLCTDGEDVSSSQYKLQDARNEIQRCQNMGIEFLVLAAGNIDAKQIAQMFGINLNNAMTHYKDSIGIEAAFLSIDLAVKGLRSEGTIPFNWSNPINLDNNKRIDAPHTRKLLGGK